MASAISCIETCHDAFGTPDGGSGRLGRGKLYPTIYENQYPGSTLEDHQPDDTKESLHKRCNKHNSTFLELYRSRMLTVLQLLDMVGGP